MPIDPGSGIKKPVRSNFPTVVSQLYSTPGFTTIDHMRILTAFCFALLLQADLTPQIWSAELTESADTAVAATTGLPKYDEIVQNIESRLGDISKEDLEHAALQGILTEFQTRVELKTPTPNDTHQTLPPSLAKKEIIGKGIAYLRIAEIRPSTAKETLEAVESLRVKTPIGGVVLDLRYVGGSDFDSVLGLAAVFVEEATPLLDWGNGLQLVPQGTTKIDLPTVILVNEATTGAAEALAAGLQQSNVGPLVGRQTTGNVQSRENIPLSSGHFLVISSGSISLADGTKLTGKGIEPDITVDVSAAEQAALFDDPYGQINQSQVDAGERMNEAELMRRQKENGGAAIDINVPPVGSEETSLKSKAIKDPILARGVDVLTGWHIFSNWKK